MPPHFFNPREIVWIEPRKEIRADYIVFVTEPTVSGLHDLKRINELRKIFNIPAGCIINKSDLNEEITEQIAGYLNKERIKIIGYIPYDESFTKAMTVGKTIIEYNESEVSAPLSDMWKKIKQAP